MARLFRVGGGRFFVALAIASSLVVQAAAQPPRPNTQPRQPGANPGQRPPATQPGARQPATKPDPKTPTRPASNPGEAKPDDPKPAATGGSSDAAIRQYRAAVAFQNKEEYEFAAGEWKAFLDKYADDPLASKARYYQGVCFFHLKKFAEARDSFETIIAKYPAFELLDATYLNLGQTYSNLGQGGKSDQLAKGVEALNTLVTKFPKSDYVAPALFNAAEILYSDGKKAEAAAKWSELIKNHGDQKQRAEALYNLGVVQEELGQHEQAGANYDTFLKDFPTHALTAEVGLRKGDTLLTAGKAAEAEKRFATAAAAKNFAAADYATLRQGAALFEQKKYPEAALVYAGIPTKFAKSQYVPNATLAAGHCFYLAGNQDAARKWLASAAGMSSEIATEASHWLARSYLKDKKSAEAIQTVEKALPKAGDGPFAATLLIDKADALYEMPDKRKEAGELYASVAKKYPQSPSAPQALYMASYAALARNDHAAALEAAQEFLKTHPQHKLATDVHVLAAESALLAGKHSEADKRYAELLSSQAGHADADAWRLRRGTALLLDKKYPDAVSLIEPLAANLKAPDHVAEAQHLLGVARLEQQQYDAAAKSLQAALKAQPKWRQADESLLALARAQQALNDAKAARGTAEQLIREFPNSKVLDVAHYRLAENAYATADYKTAEQHYRTVLDKWPQSATAPYARFGLGWTELQIGKPADAAKTLTKLLEDAPDHPLATKARFARASARQQAKQYDEALKDLDSFLKSDVSREDKSEALYTQALAYIGQQKNAEASKTLQRILEADPKFAGADRVMYELAWIKKGAGDDGEAGRYFERIVKEFPNSTHLAEAKYHSADAQFAAKNYAAAAEGFREAAAKATSADIGEKAAHKLGWALYQQEKFADAQQAFDAQLKSHPKGELVAVGNLMVGESLYKEHKSKPALEAYERAIASKKLEPQAEGLARLHAGQSAVQLKLYDAAIKHLDALLKDLKDSPYATEARYELGVARHSLGQADEAQKLFTAVADGQGGLVGAKARFMLAGLLAEKKNHKDAVREYFKVAYGLGDDQPANVKAWQAAASFEAGKAFEILERSDQAKKMYNEVVTKYPNSQQATAAQARLKALGQ